MINYGALSFVTLSLQKEKVQDVYFNQLKFKINDTFIKTRN